MSETAPLVWQFELLDKLGGPASAMAQALSALNDTMQASAAATDKLTEKLDKLGHSTKGAGEHNESFRHSLFETLEIGKSVAEGVEWMADKVFEFGEEMLSAAGKAERTHLALKYVLGSAKAATEAMEYFEAAAPNTAFAGGELRDLGTTLLTGGFKPEELSKGLDAIGDVAALNPNQSGAAAGMADMLRNIKERGFTERSLMGLSQFGIGKGAVTANLAAQLGVSPDAVKKMVGKGKISSDMGLSAIYQAISQKTGGPLGSAGAEAGGTLDALLHKLRKLPDAMFESLATSAGFAPLKTFFATLLSLVGPGSAFAREFTETFGAAFTKVITVVFGDFTGPNGTELLKSKLQSVLEVVRAIPTQIASIIEFFTNWWGVIKWGTIVLGAFFVALVAIQGSMLAYASIMSIVTTVTAIWSAVEAVAATIAFLGAASVGLLFAGFILLGVGIYELVKHWDEVLGFFEGIWTAISEFGVNLWGFAKEVGSSLVHAFVDGLTAEFGFAKEAVGWFSDIITGGTKDNLQIHSPSRVFEELGMLTGQGFGIGLANSMDQAISDASISSPSVEGSGMRGGVYAPITININRDRDDDDDSLVAKIRAALCAELANTFDSVAYETGVL